ncbi:MAG: hypothetical protein M0Q42_03315 [Xanthomonadales bacterium]|nr:hypothetical protein [Xanthomonadales bacterium]
MDVALQSPDGRHLALSAGTVVKIGSAPDCALRPALAGLPANLARVIPIHDEAWLHVQQPGVLVCVNARPIRELARLHPGDRVCIETWQLEVTGRRPEPWPEADHGEGDDHDDANAVIDTDPDIESTDLDAADRALVDTFALRSRNGGNNGSLHAGPVLHLDGQGDLVSACSSVVELSLSEPGLRLDPGQVQAWVNGHLIGGQVRIGKGDQLRIGSRRYQVETWQHGATAALPPDQPEDLPATACDADGQGAGARPGGSLIWLIGVAAVLAAALTGLLMFRGGL